MTVSARHLETILVWASQDVVNGPTKSRVLARGANSLGPIKYCINTRFLSKHDSNVKRHWDYIVPITACLLGYNSHNFREIFVELELRKN